jgi:UDP-GlcNAc:undecaprenyl-phosphate GlcNAc-1-phosphate transferase
LILISFLISFLITVPLFRALALKFKIVDKPDGVLKKHHQVTPYLGGLAVFFALWLVFFFTQDNFPIKWQGLFWGSVVIVTVGLIDDILVIRPLTKLLGQTIAAALLVYFGFWIKLNSLIYLDLLFSVFWLVSLMNAFNLIDVMDGLSTTAGLVASTGLLYFSIFFGQQDVFIFLSTFLGAQLGFLAHNYPPAKIYLGDTGSMLLGGLLGAISLILNWSSLQISLLSKYFFLPTLFALPLLEVTSLIAIRRYKKIPFYNGSRDHYAHYLKRKSWSEKQILSLTVFYYGLLIIITVLMANHFLSFCKSLFLIFFLMLFWLRVVFNAF